MASWVTNVPVSTTTPCVVVTPMSTSLLMLSAANWDFSSVVIRLSEAAGSLLVALTWASVAVRLSADDIVSSSTLFTPSTLLARASPVDFSRKSTVASGMAVRSASAPMGALAGCRLRATLGSTAAELAVSPILAPTLSLGATAAVAFGVGATGAFASGVGATAAVALGVGATGAVVSGVGATGAGASGI